MYQALYRKYRPTTFDDVISQPHITTTLKNQIINGKTAHAYLFTGSRGTERLPAPGYSQRHSTASTLLTEVPAGNVISVVMRTILLFPT